MSTQSLEGPKDVREPQGPKQPVSADADSQGWEYANGAEATRLGWERTDCEYEYQTGKWITLHIPGMLFEESNYRRKKPSVSPQGPLLPHGEQEGGAAATPESIRLNRELMQAQTRIMELQQECINAKQDHADDLKASNDLVAKLQKERDELRDRLAFLREVNDEQAVEIAHLKALLAVAEVATPDSACSPPTT